MSDTTARPSFSRMSVSRTGQDAGQPSGQTTDVLARLTQANRLHATLERRRAESKAALAHAETALKGDLEEAMEAFGVSDPQELARIAREADEENARAVSEYEETLRLINDELLRIDAIHASRDAG